MPEPIEITAKDIIRRPETAGALTGAGKEPGFLEQAKAAVQQFKELKKLAQELGIDLNGVIPGLNRLAGRPAADAGAQAQDIQPPVNPQAQFHLFIRMLQVKYGDCTVLELIERIKEEYGGKRLSQL